MTATLRRPLVIGALAAALAGLYLLAWVSWIPQPTPQYFPAGGDYGFARTYDPPTRPIEVAANAGDGQAFAAIAMDPTLARPEVFKWGPAEMAYRAQRPLAAYAAWALSGGQPGAVPWALGLLTVLGVGLFAGSVAALAARLGRDPLLAVLVVALPGVVIDLRWLCPDVVAAGLGIAGLVLWMRRPGRSWGAIALLTLAVLTRETMIMVPLAIGVDGLIRRMPLRRLLPLGLAPLALGLWTLAVWARVGALPTDAALDTRMSVPFVGMARGLAHGSTATLVLAGCTLVLALAGLARAGDALVRRVIIAQLVLAVSMGPSVWIQWNAFGRVMLPLLGVALAAALPAYDPEPATTEEASEGSPLEAGPVDRTMAT